MLAGAEFVGAMQIMIYVGGTLVLLIFGVMLTAQATFVSMKTSASEWIIAAIVGGSLFFLLAADRVQCPRLASHPAGPGFAAGRWNPNRRHRWEWDFGVRVDKTRRNR